MRRLFSTWFSGARRASTLPSPYVNELIDPDGEATAPPSPLAPCDSDLSEFGPGIRPSFNIAPYVNRSETLQSLIKLGVDLHRLEKKNMWLVEPILRLDNEKDLKRRIAFLTEYVNEQDLGAVINKNPALLTLDEDDMRIRINYLEYKRFDREMIQRIFTCNPRWFSFNTVDIDKRLGHFQKTFRLYGAEVRLLATKQPRLITYDLEKIKLNTFTIKEEMGFEKKDLKTLLLNRPILWLKDQKGLIKRFSYVHREMKMSHETILRMPHILTFPLRKIRNRNEFLKLLRRDQYNPEKPNYVSLDNVIEGTDEEFCENVAKCDVEKYNMYLKSR